MSEITSFKEELNRKLLDMIIKSKEDKSMSISFANSIIILNVCPFNFSGMDLSNISIPNANLECALMNGTKLINSDLSNVHFRFAQLFKADLTNSNKYERIHVS